MEWIILALFFLVFIPWQLWRTYKAILQLPEHAPCTDSGLPVSECSGAGLVRRYGGLAMQMTARQVLIDLVAILESPHTSVTTRWETGSQYKVTLQQAKAVIKSTASPLKPSAFDADGYAKDGTFIADLTRNGTHGRVYGGDPNLVHVPDGQRVRVGQYVADYVGNVMRDVSGNLDSPKLLCPGCYMVVIYNAATSLARRNGQSMRELGATLSHAFADLAFGNGPESMESINVRED